jgi:integrative and conjugative element protein (TIGR02256 family)
VRDRALGHVSGMPRPRPGASPVAPRALRLARAALEFVLTQSRGEAPLETGGLLVGRSEPSYIEVIRASGAGPGAERGKSSFTRDGEYSQRQLDEAVRALDGKYDYVGEWHSHPRRGGRWSGGPSPRDRHSLAWIANNRAYQCPYPVLLLCERGRSRGWEVSAYRWSGARLEALEVTPYGE